MTICETDITIINVYVPNALKYAKFWNTQSKNNKRDEQLSSAISTLISQ